MNTKLTLNIDDAIVERAKQYARRRHRSLSKVVQQYLDYVTQAEADPGEVTETVTQLADTLRVTETDDELKYRYLKEKYLDASAPR